MQFLTSRHFMGLVRYVASYSLSPPQKESLRQKTQLVASPFYDAKVSFN